MHKNRTLYGIICGLLSLLMPALGHAAKVKVKNCTNFKLTVNSYNKGDKSRIAPKSQATIPVGKTRTLKCKGSKCHIRAASSSWIKGKEKLKRNQVGDIRVEYKKGKLKIKSGHTCD